MPCQLLLALGLLFLEPPGTRLEALPGPHCARFFIGEFADSGLRHPEIEGQRDVARAHQVAAATLDAVSKTVTAQLGFVIGTGIPEQLLRQ